MSLPQLSGELFLTDGGIETTLIFQEGIELPDFAAFLLLRDKAGREALKKYFRSYAEIAKARGLGLILETATWRANPDWAARQGYAPSELAEANRASVRLLEEIREEASPTPTVISGCVGPRGDGYVPGSLMTADQAAAYHWPQIAAFTEASADLVTAITMNYVQEAVGVARAAEQAGIPAVISFTVETDGRLPGGQSLGDAIEQVDGETGGYPAYYMINCAHPTHFSGVLEGRWTSRIRGLRANASRMSHAELNESPTLDIGNPDELGGEYAQLLRQLPRLNVMGGCCGTDHRHVIAIADACGPLFRN